MKFLVTAIFLFCVSPAHAEVVDVPSSQTVGVRTIHITLTDIQNLRRSCRYIGENTGAQNYQCDLVLHNPPGFIRELRELPPNKYNVVYLPSRVGSYNIYVSFTAYFSVIRVTILAGKQDDPREYFDKGLQQMHVLGQISKFQYLFRQ